MRASVLADMCFQAEPLLGHSMPFIVFSGNGPVAVTRLLAGGSVVVPQATSRGQCTPYNF